MTAGEDRWDRDEAYFDYLRRDVRGRPEWDGTPTVDILAHLKQAKEQRRAQIRKLVVEHRRFDVLARYVLGLDPQPHHLRMMDFISTHTEGMVLGWRGAAKTKYCTITQAIGEIVCDPDVTILFASNAADQSKLFLTEVKNHLQKNEELRAIFGDFHTGAERWTDTEIRVAGRRSLEKESTIMCAGMDTVLPSRHFRLIIADDLVTDENSSTAGQRQKVHDYFYRTLLPCCAMPDGRMFIVGTRWHDEDLYGWLLEEDYKDSSITIPVLDDDDQSVWPEVFPTARMHRIRKGNLGAFELQYMCRSGKSLGGIITPDHFDYYDELPADVFVWQGVDPAISQQDQNANFAHVTVAIDKARKRPWLVDFVDKKMVFPEQVTYIVKQFDLHPEAVRVVVESNAYQLALAQQLKADGPHVPVLPRWTIRDKVARANQLAGVVGEKGIMIRRHHHRFLRSLCAVPKSGRWDLFDAFYIAVMQGLKGARRRRRGERVGLI